MAQIRDIRPGDILKHDRYNQIMWVSHVVEGTPGGAVVRGTRYSMQSGKVLLGDKFGVLDGWYRGATLLKEGTGEHNKWLAYIVSEQLIRGGE